MRDARWPTESDIATVRASLSGRKGSCAKVIESGETGPGGAIADPLVRLREPVTAYFSILYEWSLREAQASLESTKTTDDANQSLDTTRRTTKRA